MQHSSGRARVNVPLIWRRATEGRFWYLEEVSGKVIIGTHIGSFGADC